MKMEQFRLGNKAKNGIFHVKTELYNTYSRKYENSMVHKHFRYTF